ncbi:MAG: polymer-forming cytoskeletal protein [Rhodocyclaceae bacterium]|nr:polymer-forming cytoskeletal protein [Rhodocyclaceae bacterium]
MDLFKLRRDGAGSESESARSLEQLLTAPAPLPAAETKPAPAPAPEEAPPADVQPPTNIASQTPVRSESTIAEGFHFNGVVKAPTDLRVDGTLDGDIEVRSLVVGANGSVSGQCRCDSLFIDGRFHGKAECRELHLNASAVVDGEVTYSVLCAQRGAKMTGKYVYKKRDLPQAG